MVTQSQNVNDYKKINNFTLDGKNLFIGNIDSGKKFCIVYYNGKCDFTNLLSVCKLKKKYDKKINMIFIYYFFKQIQKYLTNTYLKGSCNLSLDVKNFNRIKIPLPSLEEQEKIIVNIQALEKNTNIVQQGLDGMKMRRRMYMEAVIKGATNKGINQIKQLGEVCDYKNGKALTSANFIDGIYPVISSGKHAIGYHNKYNMVENTIICASSGSAGLISKYKTKIWGSDCFGIYCKNTEYITSQYLYNYLITIQESIYKKQKRCGQVHMDAHTLSKLTIPIPPLEYQQKMEIVLNQLDTIEEALNNQIKINNFLIKDAFINSLDNYGNPNSFNLNNLCISDSDIGDEEDDEIVITPPKKHKSKKKKHVISSDTDDEGE
jgi:restriction endonuclease S subunit